MKKSMRILSGFLSCLLLLTGCSPAGQQSSSAETPNAASNTAAKTSTSTTGGYTQAEITPKERSDFQLIRQLSDQTLVCYTSYLEEKYVSKDNGQSWEKTKGPGSSYTHDDEKRFSQAAMAADGTVYAVYDRTDNNYTADEIRKAEIKKISPTGEVTDFIIPSFVKMYEEKQNIQIHDIGTLGNDRIYITGTYGKEYITTPDGEIASTGGTDFSRFYSTENGKELYELPLYNQLRTSTIYDDNYFYVLDFKNQPGNHLVWYNLSDGREAGRFDISQSLQANLSPSLFSSANGELYALQADKIYRINIAEQKVEQLMDGSKMVLGAPATYIRKIIVGKENEFITLCDRNFQPQIWRFYYDVDLQTPPTTPLSIWSLYASDSLQTTINAFSQVNPQVDIQIESVFSNGNQGITQEMKEDAIKNFNTRLLAGEAPDIIVLDGMPAEKYADQGLLLGLESIDTSHMYPCFSSQMKRQNGLFYLPLLFTMPTISMRKPISEFPKTFDAWATYIEQTPAMTGETAYELFTSTRINSIHTIQFDYPEEQRPFLYFSDFQDIYDLFWQANEPALIENGTINEENFRKWMNLLKLLTDKNDCFNSSDYTQSKYGEKLENKSREYLDHSLSSPNGILNMSLNSEIKFFASARMDANASVWARLFIPGVEFGEYTAKNESTIDNAAPLPSLNGATWQPKLLMSINAKGENKETALQFIQAALTPAIQQFFDDPYFIPVIKEFPQMLKEKKLLQYEQMKQMNPEHFKEATGEPEIFMTMDLDRLTEQLTTPLLTDYVIRRLVWEPVEAYAKGEIDIEQAITEIKQLTKIYLAERTR